MAHKAEYHLLSDECHRYVANPRRGWQWLLTVLNIILFVFSAFVMIRASRPSLAEIHTSDQVAQTEQLPEVTVKRYWWTDYSWGDKAERDARWDAIRPSHGFIAVDEHLAASKNWPESHRLPSDQNKRVYLLEAYHQLHCLTIIRKTLGELSTGRATANTTYQVEHADHCFDALRQHVQCHADNTPLYSFGDNTAGDGQAHRCKSWDALRDFATQNSACYRDSVGAVPLQDHFGHCDDGQDGVADGLPAQIL